jgi:hypothetical protein
MDFNALGENSPIYVIRKKPFQFLTGTLKSKVSKQPSNPYMPQAQQLPIDVIVNVGGADETLPNVPIGMEALEYKGSYYCTTTDGAQQAISGLMQIGREGIENQPYFNSLLTDGEKALESINPQYAEGKRQARVVKELQDRQDAQDKKLDKILSRLDEFFSPSSPKK